MKRKLKTLEELRETNRLRQKRFQDRIKASKKALRDPLIKAEILRPAGDGIEIEMPDDFDQVTLDPQARGKA